MSGATGTVVAASAPRTTSMRRVAAAAVVGTAIEWYDYFVYAALAGLVFSRIMFEPAGPGFATVLSFLTVGISFLFRPLGAIIAGHLGDKHGRRPVLVGTVIIMGFGTALLGVLPTYQQAGVVGPVLIVLLRIVQGLAVGAEWGGASLLAVEHAKRNGRGLMGSMVQLGVPIGLLLSSAGLAVLDAVFPGDSFLVWGWRIAFWISLALVAVGFWVRRAVDESPVFEELAERKAEAKVPIARLFRRFAALILLAACVMAGNNAVGYMTTGGFVQNYATDPTGPLGLDRGPVLWAVTLSAAIWGISILFSGWLSDRIGRRTMFAVGYVVQAGAVLALWPLVNLGNILLLGLALALLAFALGLTNGGALSAWFAELFPASVRFSGASIAYAIGAILGGAFAPTIAALIFNSTRSTVGITWYLLGMTAVGLIGSLLLRERAGIGLRAADEADQEKGLYAWQPASPLMSRK